MTGAAVKTNKHRPAHKYYAENVTGDELTVAAILRAKQLNIMNLLYLCRAAFFKLGDTTTTTPKGGMDKWTEWSAFLSPLREISSLIPFLSK